MSASLRVSSLRRQYSLTLVFINTRVITATTPRHHRHRRACRRVVTHRRLAGHLVVVAPPPRTDTYAYTHTPVHLYTRRLVHSCLYTHARYPCVLGSLLDFGFGTRRRRRLYVARRRL